ncbi:Uncharacterized protein Adt_44698 [Abeliophyllum distichum]|uniref:SWIB domain-containing protein n=1 Tax=Abeliophyllum distichum TaxID=126358 RepID=A0ABD1PBK6_9LAMI
MKDNFWVEEVNGQPSVPMRRKRKIVQRKIQFIGWGSKRLIEFLESVGEDTGKKQSKLDLVKIITRYVKDKCLNSPEKKKKKKILCDERLHALFGKKSLSQAKIHYLLEEHLAENHDKSDDEDSSEEENYEEKNASLLKTGPTSKINKVPETPKSCFAAVIPENIKLVYLKRSLVQDLLKVPENFETKVVGSFVRLKSDRNDIFQKHRFHLEQVTGIKNVAGAADAVSGVRLQVSNCLNDTPICMLSDDNFSEEECEDLRDRVKSGLLKRPTVVELELKAQLLHVDITKHWIPKELSLLQKLIDHTNEKGRRKEYPYLPSQYPPRTKEGFFVQCNIASNVVLQFRYFTSGNLNPCNQKLGKLNASGNENLWNIQLLLSHGGFPLRRNATLPMHSGLVLTSVASSKSSSFPSGGRNRRNKCLPKICRQRKYFFLPQGSYLSLYRPNDGRSLELYS